MNVCADDVACRQAQCARSCGESPSSPKHLPAAPPDTCGRRLLQPDVVVIDHAPRREDAGERVDDQRGVEVLQIARTDDDGGDEQAGPHRGPGAGAKRSAARVSSAAGPARRSPAGAEDLRRFANQSAT